MRVGIVDVGGNTVRLLVASVGGNGVERERQERVVLRLGAEIERTGSIPRGTLAAVADAVARFLEIAADAGCRRSEVLVTSPRRQAKNRKQLERTLADAASSPVYLLSAEEEARLVFAGAISGARMDQELVAVCDVGGGSTELVAGSPAFGAAWFGSVDLGSLRIAQRHLEDARPSRRNLEHARAAAAEAAEKLRPPPALSVVSALATGGTARALRKMVGARLGLDELAAALEIARATKPGRLTRQFGLPRWRADTLVGGALLLLEVQRVLETPFTVAAGGLREGAALALAERVALAA